MEIGKNIITNDPVLLAHWKELAKKMREEIPGSTMLDYMYALKKNDGDYEKAKAEIAPLIPWFKVSRTDSCWRG